MLDGNGLHLACHNLGSAVLSALAVSYGALNRLSHCSFNRTFPGLRELATWHPLPGWNGARPVELIISMWLARAIYVNSLPIGIELQSRFDGEQKWPAAAIRTFWPGCAVRLSLLSKAPMN